MPALCLPQRKPVHIEDLVLRSATGESVPVYVPSRGNGRAGRHMWVSADDRALWEELVGEKTPLPAAPPEDEDDVITFAEQEIDRTCRAGEEGWFVSDGRPLRDLDQPTGGFTLPRMPVQRSRDRCGSPPSSAPPPPSRWDVRHGSSGCARAAAS